MGNWSSRPRLGAFHSKSLIKMSRGGTPQAISSESSAERHFERRNVMTMDIS
jgi:hypothetical protein